MKIALVGTCPSSRMLAPYTDGSWEIWACSPGNAHGILPRVTRWFEIHGDLGWPESGKWGASKYVDWLNEQDFPVYAQSREFIKRATIYPLDEMIAKFSLYFFTSTFAYMMALAIAEGATEIGLFGIDMTLPGEYCIAPETKILTADLRWIEASSIAIGDTLIGFDEERTPDQQRQWRSTKVEKTVEVVRPSYRLTLEDGTELISSAEHRWLTFGEHEIRWRETQRIVTPYHRSDRPTKIVKLTNTWTEDRSWEAGYLAAAFDGEGWLQQKNEDGDGSLVLGFAQRENAMSQTVLDAAKTMGLDLYCSSKNGENNDCFQYRIAGGRAPIMEFLGRIRPRRLMSKFDPSLLGSMMRKDAVGVVKSEFLGEIPLIGLTTSTGTFVAEGFASHNSDQRPAMQHFIMLCMAMGIRIGAPDESDIMRPPPLYGWVDATPHGRKLHVYQNELEERLKKVEQAKRQAELDAALLKGASEGIDYARRVWGNDRVPLRPLSSTEQKPLKLVTTNE